MCEEQDAGGATLVTYVYSPVYVDEPVQLQRTAAHPLGAGEIYFHQNARADVVALTDETGAVVEKWVYDDYGRAYDAETKQPVSESAVGSPYGFQGRRLDAETGLYYFRARVYDPATGRFLQRDPVWDAGNLGNQYSFVGNGPTSGLDPSGTTRKGVKALRRVITQILKGENGPRGVGQPGSPTNANPGRHGGRAHNQRIAEQRESATKRGKEVRTNQQQVDVNGNKAGDNRPDNGIGTTKQGQEVMTNTEFDTRPDALLQHAGEVIANDPSAVGSFQLIDPNTGETLAGVTFKGDGKWNVWDPDNRLDEAFQLTRRSDGGYASLLPGILAPNAMSMSNTPCASVEDVVRAGAWDVASHVDPTDLTSAVDQGLDYYTGAKTPRAPWDRSAGGWLGRLNPMNQPSDMRETVAWGAQQIGSLWGKLTGE